MKETCSSLKDEQFIQKKLYSSEQRVSTCSSEWVLMAASGVHGFVEELFDSPAKRTPRGKPDQHCLNVERLTSRETCV